MALTTATAGDGGRLGGGVGATTLTRFGGQGQEEEESMLPDSSGPVPELSCVLVVFGGVSGDAWLRDVQALHIDQTGTHAAVML